MTHPKTPSSVDKFVGARVRMARRSQKISQTELGSMINRTFQQVQKYEKGTNRISAGALFEIARVLNRDVEWFFRDAAVNDEIAPSDQDSQEFRDCVQLLMELRYSPSLGSVRQVLELVKQAGVPPVDLGQAA